MDWTSEKVYYLVKKTLDGQVLMLKPKALYLMLADKINQLSIERETESKSYNHMARMSDKPSVTK
jgi:hypothetical protein